MADRTPPPETEDAKSRSLAEELGIPKYLPTPRESIIRRISPLHAFLSSIIVEEPPVLKSNTGRLHGRIKLADGTETSCFISQAKPVSSNLETILVRNKSIDGPSHISFQIQFVPRFGVSHDEIILRIFPEGPNPSYKTNTAFIELRCKLQQEKLNFSNGEITIKETTLKGEGESSNDSNNVEIASLMKMLGVPDLEDPARLGNALQETLGNLLGEGELPQERRVNTTTDMDSIKLNNDPEPEPEPEHESTPKPEAEPESAPPQPVTTTEPPPEPEPAPEPESEPLRVISETPVGQKRLGDEASVGMYAPEADSNHPTAGVPEPEPESVPPQPEPVKTEPAPEPNPEPTVEVKLEEVNLEDLKTQIQEASLKRGFQFWRQSTGETLIQNSDGNFQKALRNAFNSPVEKERLFSELQKLTTQQYGAVQNPALNLFFLALDNTHVSTELKQICVEALVRIDRARGSENETTQKLSGRLNEPDDPIAQQILEELIAIDSVYINEINPPLNIVRANMVPEKFKSPEVRKAALRGMARALNHLALSALTSEDLFRNDRDLALKVVSAFDTDNLSNSSDTWQIKRNLTNIANNDSLPNNVKAKAQEILEKLN